MAQRRNLKNNPDFIKDLGLMNDREVAEKWGVCNTTVYNIRTALNIAPCRVWSETVNKKQILPSCSELEKEIAELGSMNQVAKKYGVSRQAVQQKLERNKCQKEIR